MINIETIQPIECEAQFQTLQFQPLSKIPIGETFVAVVSLSNLSPFPLLVEQGAWKINTANGVTSQPFASHLSELILKPQEKSNDVVVLYISETESSTFRPGSYSLKWKR